MNSTGPVIPRGVVTVLTALAALGAIMAFAVMFGLGMSRAWSAHATPSYDEAFVYIATGLAALVGGIVAVGFGQKPASLPGGGGLPRAPASLAKRNFVGVGRALVFAGGRPHVAATDIWRSRLGVTYATVYFVWGIAAVITWVARGEVAPDLVRNLATTFLGLFLPIVGSFMGNR